AEKKKAGFVVQVLCYSPYGRSETELGALVDPYGVEDQQDKWGFITRLAHLEDLAQDANSPFDLYKKGDNEQFNLEIKEVTVDGEMPEGIGIWDELIEETTQAGTRQIGLRQGGLARTWILIDPMTRETISKESVLDEEGKPKLYRGQPVYKVNDHWFVLNAKFLWRDAPEPPAQPVTSPYGMPRQMPTTSTPSPSSGSSGRSLPDDF
ncbi:unnamed protein product, partial [marine sediment metagenome]